MGVILTAGYAYGDAVITPAAGATKPTAQDKVQQREALRRAAVEEQQKRKDAYERACAKPHRTDMEFDQCRTAYKKLHTTN